jgi:hypothetical protein
MEEYMKKKHYIKISALALFLITSLSALEVVSENVVHGNSAKIEMMKNILGMACRYGINITEPLVKTINEIKEKLNKIKFK